MCFLFCLQALTFFKSQPRIDNKWVAVKPHGGVAFTEDTKRERAKANQCISVLRFGLQTYPAYLSVTHLSPVVEIR